MERESGPSRRKRRRESSGSAATRRCPSAPSSWVLWTAPSATTPSRTGSSRLEEATGLAFRFVIGKSNDMSKMAALEREVEEYDDFVLLDLEEEYSRLPYKTLPFFKAAHALFDSDFNVKADDDIYLRQDRLSLLLAKERPHTHKHTSDA